MYRQDCLTAVIGAMPQEMMRCLRSDHLEAGPFQRRDDGAPGQRRQRSHASAAATGTS
jgi:hypothetical protein